MHIITIFVHKLFCMATKYDKTKERILSESLNIFGRYGFTRTNIESIARACQKGRRTIYLYFKSKQDIYDEVVKAECTRLAAQVETIVASAVEPRQKLVKLVGTRMGAIKKLVFSYKALTNCFFQKKSLFEKLRSEYDAREKRIIESILAEGVNCRVFTVRNIEQAAQNIQVALKAFEHMFIRRRESEADRQAQEEIVNILLFGVANCYSKPI